MKYPHVPDSVRFSAVERDELRERLSEWLDVPMAILSLIWTAMLVVQLASPGNRWVGIIGQADTIIWVIFGLQFVVEFALASQKRRYLRHNWLTAISVVLPMFRIARIARSLRALRSLSLFGIILRTNRATRAAAEMFGQGELRYVLALVAIVSLVGAAGVTWAEQGEADSSLRSFGEALWWAVTLVTTVNVGVEPVSVEGRVIAFLLRVVGVAIFSYITARIASYLVGLRETARDTDASKKDEQTDRERRVLIERIEHLQTSIDELRAEWRRPPAGDAEHRGRSA